MSVLVVGVSHKSAPVALLERLALDADGVTKLVTDVVGSAHVAEATVISTCNRLEVYADVDRFHGSIEEVSRLLVDRAGQSTDALVPHLYVHYDDGAVSHLFNVAAGLDSMVVGEGQILGQTREALRMGQELGAVGPALNVLFQQALRVGKRAHAETEIDRAAPSLVSAALERVEVPVAGVHAVVVGAGAMASLAVATLHRLGAGRIDVVNRTTGNAEHLARQYTATSRSLAELTALLGQADLVVSCTGAIGEVITVDDVAMSGAGEKKPLALVDLAMPHDIDPSVVELPNISLIDLASLSEDLRHGGLVSGVDGVRRIVAEEISSFLTARRQSSVTPTVVALRSMATSVVDAEVERLTTRLPDLDDTTLAEVRQTVRRVADKLLHEPTVRVKELANETAAVSYAAALAELFALDPDAVEAVTRPGVAELPVEEEGQR